MSTEYKFDLDGLRWRSVQHYFQSKRIIDLHSLKLLVASSKNPLSLSTYICTRGYMGKVVPIRRIDTTETLLTEKEEDKFNKQIQNILRTIKPGELRSEGIQVKRHPTPAEPEWQRLQRVYKERRIKELQKKTDKTPDEIDELRTLTESKAFLVVDQPKGQYLKPVPYTADIVESEEATPIEELVEPPEPPPASPVIQKKAVATFLEMVLQSA